MRIDWLQSGIGLVLAAAAGWLGRRYGRLTSSGLLAAALVGSFVFGVAGWHWGIPFLLYLLSANIWWRYSAIRRLDHAPSPTRKPWRSQGWKEVLASTIWAASLALLHLLSPQTSAILAAYVGALATMAGDSWATDVGMLAMRSPRLITSGRRVRPGTPGAVTALGAVAIVGAAWLIGFVALLSVVIRANLDQSPWDRGWLWLPFAATVGGLVGCFVDSLLGAAAQAMFYCEHCQQESEERVHTCGKEATRQRGWPWLTNNAVNWLSSVVGAAVTMQVFLWVAQLGTRW